MKILSCCDSERGLLATLIKYGSNAYHEISDLDITESTMTIDSHNVIFKCLAKLFKEQDDIIPDIPLIYSSSTDLGLKSWFQRDEEVSYLNSIMNYPVQEENTRIFALKIKKLEIARKVINRLEEAQNCTLQLTGNESINEIFGIIEKSIIDCGKFLSTQDKTATIMGEGLEEYFEELEKNPIEQIGISTGMPVYDKAIGGGLRTGSVNVIASRAKVGKSSLSINIGLHIARLDIPVLYLDSEMSKQDTQNRMVACLSEINSTDIETGQYNKFYSNKIKVDTAIQKLKKLPFYYQSIAGQPLENQVSLIKRWIITEVGLKKNGEAKQCVIIYDYLKLMNEEEGKGYQEYQALGFLMTSLVNFTKKYNFPILSFIQTNRDGISKEDSSTISQSDRVLWFCSSLAIFKRKEAEEMEADGYENGNRKLIVTDCRYGPGLTSGDYINCNFNQSICKITEGKTKFEIWKNKKQTKSNIIQNESYTEEKVPF
jgi:replicative DNA helicase